jgi:RNA polymerase sigma factor (sigma-70 family)
MIFNKLFQKEQTDEELIRRYQQTGNLALVADLYQRYAAMIFGVCLKYLKDEEDSKDVSRSLFEKLVKVLKENEVQNFKSWLHVIVRNQCLMHLRTQKTRNGKIVPLNDRFLAGKGSENEDFQETFDKSATSSMENLAFWNPHDEDLLEENLNLLEKAITHLPSEQRTCIDLFYLKEKCYKEISELTGYEINKVKSYIQNGKRNLKIYLEKK